MGSGGEVAYRCDTISARQINRDVEVELTTKEIKLSILPLQEKANWMWIVTD